MPRCNCPGGSCSCKVQGGAGITVTGIGTAADPLVIASLFSSIADGLQFDDSPTLNFTTVGDGTPSDPLIVSATVLNVNRMLFRFPVRAGNVAVSTAINQRIYNDSGRTLTLDLVRTRVITPPATTPIIVDVNLDGTTIFTTQANRPSIAAAANTALSGTPQVVSWPNGSYLDYHIDAIGTGTVGADLQVDVWAH